MLGFVLACTIFLSAGCLKSLDGVFTQEVEEAQVYDAARYTVDTVVQPGKLPVPVSEAEPGTYAVNQVVPAGEPIPLQHFKEVIDSSTPEQVEDVKAELEARPPVVTQEERVITTTQSTGTGDALALLLAPIAGPYAPLIAFLGSAIPLGISRYRNKARADRKEALSDAMVTGVDQIFDAVALLPDKDQARKIEGGMKDILQRSQQAAGVAKEAAEVVARLKTPKKKPLIEG